MTYHWLSVHLGYRCRHAGACCSSGWPIPVEPDRVAAIDLLVAEGPPTPDGRAWLVPPAGAGSAGTLALQASGACVFHRGGPRGCTVHSARPASCEHFPYVCAVDPRGVQVTLSHYCPTAADLLFADQAPPDIVEGPRVLADGRWPQGLDAADCLPPVRGGMLVAAEPDAVRRGRRASSQRPVLMDWDEVSAWQSRFVRTLAADREVPGPPELGLFEQARGSVPPPWSWPAAPADVGTLWSTWVAPLWSTCLPIVGRYLAARAHGSWALYFGEGLDELRRAVDTARAVLQVESVRQAAGGRAPDRALLKEAIRQSDLLLVHYADPRLLFGPSR